MSDESYFREYAAKAMSLENRYMKGSGREHSYRYMVSIELAELGDAMGEEGDVGLLASFKVPRSVDNELGLTLMYLPATRRETAKMLRDLADMCEAGDVMLIEEKLV